MVESKAAAEALIPKFKLVRALNQGSCFPTLVFHFPKPFHKTENMFREEKKKKGKNS